MVVSIATKLGWKNLSVRVGFAADMAARNAERTKVAAKGKERGQIFQSYSPPTRQDYYSDTSQTEFSAVVLDCKPLNQVQINSLNLSSEVVEMPTHSVVLDSTLFYPEGVVNLETKEV